MLDGLKNIKNPGNCKGILFFLGNIIGNKRMPYQDLQVLCTYAPVDCNIVFPDIIHYCAAFGWIELSGDSVRISPELAAIYQSSKKLSEELINITISTLFERNIFRIDMFTYDLTRNKIRFHNEYLSLCYSAIRNVLVNMGFFDVERSTLYADFFVSSSYETLVSKLFHTEKKKITLNQLRKKIEADAEIGEKAEKFSLQYEKKRVGEPLSEKVRIISDIDVTAGYDMISFEGNDSQDYDRFIEVKAASKEMGFIWSRNEYEISKLKGNHYYLYLVDISKIEEDGYAPVIIQNPAKNIMQSSEWLVESQSYRAHRI